MAAGKQIDKSAGFRPLMLWRAQMPPQSAFKLTVTGD
jgi:hypothetical protein